MNKNLSFIRYSGRYTEMGTKDVYLLMCRPPECRYPVFKVGFSINVIERVYTGAAPIASNFPFPVWILCAFDTSFYREIERKIHNEWRENRHDMYGGNGSTEWFSFCGGGKSSDDIASKFISIAIEEEKSIGDTYRLLTPNINPYFEEVDYSDCFCILGDWNYWYNNHSDAGKALHLSAMANHRDKLFKERNPNPMPRNRT